MTKKERNLIRGTHCTPVERDAARAVFRQKVDAQNAREERLPLRALCVRILAEYKSLRLSVRERSIFCPFVEVIPSSKGTMVHIYDLNTDGDDGPFYTGSLAAYWQTMLGRR